MPAQGRDGVLMLYEIPSELNPKIPKTKVGDGKMNLLSMIAKQEIFDYNYGIDKKFVKVILNVNKSVRD